MLAVGTASGTALVFNTKDLFREACSSPAGFAAAPPAAASPIICVPFGSLPLQRVHLMSCRLDRPDEAAESGGGKSSAEQRLHLLAVGVDGSLHGTQLQQDLLQRACLRPRFADRHDWNCKAEGTWRVPAAAPPEVSISTPNCRCSNAPILTAAQLQGGLSVVVTCWESGSLQLWVLPATAARSGTLMWDTSSAASAKDGFAKDGGSSASIVIRYAWYGCDTQGDTRQRYPTGTPRDAMERGVYLAQQSLLGNLACISSQHMEVLYEQEKHEFYHVA